MSAGTGRPIVARTDWEKGVRVAIGRWKVRFGVNVLNSKQMFGILLSPDHALHSGGAGRSLRGQRSIGCELGEAVELCRSVPQSSRRGAAQLERRSRGAA